MLKVSWKSFGNCKDWGNEKRMTMVILFSMEMLKLSFTTSELRKPEIFMLKVYKLEVARCQDLTCSSCSWSCESHWRRGQWSVYRWHWASNSDQLSLQDLWPGPGAVLCLFWGWWTGLQWGSEIGKDDQIEQGRYLVPYFHLGTSVTFRRKQENSSG